MAAQRLATDGWSVDVYEHMPSMGRKLLLAGRSGLNLTHSEQTERLVERYEGCEDLVRAAVESFDADALREWAADLGETTFVGSSGRVFPDAHRATTLVRSWLAHLGAAGVGLHTRHRWTGFDPEGAPAITVEHEGVASTIRPDAVVLALGGASWPKVGSDGAWTDVLRGAGVDVAPLRPANCGFVVEWTDVFRDRFEGEPLKNLRLTVGERSVRGEMVVTRDGVEGGAVYAVGAPLRDGIERDGSATVLVDLHPDLDEATIVERLDRRRDGESTSSLLRRALRLSPVAIGLLRETTANVLPSDAVGLAALVKRAPLRLTGVESIERAISSAGGVRRSELDDRWMLQRMPGVFVVGEMVDWEAPTGGYLLQATFSSAVAAARGVVEWAAGRATGA